MESPSLIPADRLDRDFYVVLEDFRSGAAFRETDEDVTYVSLIHDLLTGQYDRIQRVIAFNPTEGWSRDASWEIAAALEQHLSAHPRTIANGLQEFIEDQLGRRIGTQLSLPLTIS